MGEITVGYLFLPLFPDFDKSVPFLMIHLVFWYGFSYESP